MAFHVTVTTTLVDGVVERRRGDSLSRLLWCSTHHEPAWVYSDGSIDCPYDRIVECNNEHTITTDTPWSSPPRPGAVSMVNPRTTLHADGRITIEEN